MKYPAPTLPPRNLSQVIKTVASNRTEMNALGHLAMIQYGCGCPSCRYNQRKAEELIKRVSERRP